MGKMKWLGLAGLLLASAAFGEEEVFLSCSYHTSIDLGNGAAEGVTGNISFDITYVDEKNVTVQTEKCGEVVAVGTATPVDLRFACSGVKGGMRLDYSFIVNRISGELEQVLEVGGKGGGLMFKGSCSPAKKLF
ncbi:hypothetical protein [Mesorhizobium sp.]|uniref:hypothetical protein n=1 Tax=Mesorhizobium sp. TaxID=1871066 RepID=UPI000FE72308|nr:hypothetical protein [Mesorhizobium sp.]RWF64130.1 MAG: hypothetical protein EOS47_16300 [Mesorhizobium sp.]TIT44725.1 MAG: hypothetical protein E5W76_01220 [Mesorhizobium sp.]